MPVEVCLPELEKFYKQDKKNVEDEDPYKFFPETYGGSIKAALDSFDFVPHDEEWSGMYSKWKSGKVKPEDIKLPRLKVAFCSSGKKEFKEFYLSGQDDHAITDVDVLRVGANFVRAQGYRIKHIKDQLLSK